MIGFAEIIPCVDKHFFFCDSDVKFREIFEVTKQKKNKNSLRNLWLQPRCTLGASHFWDWRLDRYIVLKTSVTKYQPKRRNIPEERRPQKQPFFMVYVPWWHKFSSVVLYFEIYTSHKYPVGIQVWEIRFWAFLVYQL